LTEFDKFWAAYPRKIGKLAAAAEFKKALKLTTFKEILAGVENYKQHKPAYADWAHAKTWLHQGRWMDEWDDATHADDRGHIPPCRSYAECLKKVLGRS
jgi:hypothetical protein